MKCAPAVSVLSVLWVICGALGCGGQPRGPTSDDTCCHPPWVPPPGADLRVVEGRIVTPEGDGVPDVEVQLVYEGNAYEPASVVYEARTRADGSVRFEGVSPGVNFYVVARGPGYALTAPLSRSEDPFTVRVAPLHTVDLTARCNCPDGPPPWNSQWVRISWLPYHQRVAFLSLGTEEPLTFGDDHRFVLPGRSDIVEAVRTRELLRPTSPLRLPEGRFLVATNGGCGTAFQQLEISGEGPHSLHLEIPDPDSSDLYITLSPESSRDAVYPTVYFLGRQMGARVPRGHYVLVDTVPPGEYTIDGVTCHHPIEIPPRSQVTVTIGPGQCSVQSTLRIPSEAPTAPRPRCRDRSEYAE